MTYENQSKLQRAQKWAKEQGKEGDEATIKARYLELGGLITGADVDEEAEAAPKAKKSKKADEEAE